MEFLQEIVDLVRIASITDLIDVLLVAFLIYKVMTLLKDTTAERLIKGVAVIFMIILVAKWAQLNTISYVLDQTYTIVAFALVAIFQPELRRMLEQIGKGKMMRGLLSSKEGGMTDVESAITQITTACESMSGSRTGALIVLERVEKLGEIIKNGTYVDAETSAELVKNIFYPKSPLHDGAMIIREGRILAAGCVLPLSGNQLSRDLGTRHRAAVGMSETSDAVLVVVSEETGSISVAIGGMLKRHLAPETLEKVLRTELIPAEQESRSKTPRAMLRKWRGGNTK